jgi:hypothetical protein
MSLKEYEQTKNVSMKTFLSIIIIGGLFLLSVSGFGQNSKFRDIAGKWEVVGDPNANATLSIVDSSTIEFSYMGEKKTISNYTIDYSKSPYWLDFNAADSSSSFQVKSILQKVGDDVLKWQLFIDEDRSPYFTSSSGEVFYLKKARQSAVTAVGVTTTTTGVATVR